MLAFRGEAPDEASYAAVIDWRTSNMFSYRERLAIEFAERLSLEPQGFARDEAEPVAWISIIV
jgi:alkylhydroperoxidase family enzyme